jgi:hypothetical protein
MRLAQRLKQKITICTSNRGDICSITTRVDCLYHTLGLLLLQSLNPRRDKLLIVESISVWLNQWSREMGVTIQVPNSRSVNRVWQFLNETRNFGVDRLVYFFSDLLSFVKRAFTSNSFHHGSNGRAISVNIADLSFVRALLNLIDFASIHVDP